MLLSINMEFQHNVSVDNDRLLIYDCADNEHHFNGLPTIHSVALNHKDNRAGLCDVLPNMHHPQAECLSRFSLTIDTPVSILNV